MFAELKGLGDFDAKVKGWFAAVETAAGAAAVGLAKNVLDNALVNSPQFSGDYTASWRVGIGTVDTSYEVGAVQMRPDNFGDFIPFGRGDAPAIQFAKAKAASVWPTKLPLGTSIYISNSARHDEPYAWKIENNQINFRSVNMGAYDVGRNAVKRVWRRFNTINKTQLDVLKMV